MRLLICCLRENLFGLGFDHLNFRLDYFFDRLVFLSLHCLEYNLVYLSFRFRCNWLDFILDLSWHMVFLNGDFMILFFISVLVDRLSDRRSICLLLVRLWWPYKFVSYPSTFLDFTIRHD